MTRRAIGWTAVLVCAACSLFDTAPPGSEVQWEKTYGAGESDHGKDIRQTADGGYIIAGLTGSMMGDSTGPYLVKTDAAGNKLWDRCWPSPDDREFFAVRQCADGGYVCAGYIEPVATASAQDAYLVRTDANGDTLWTRSYGYVGIDRAQDVVVLADGYVFTGYVAIPGRTACDVWLVRTDADGDPLWTRLYGENGHYERGYALQQTQDNGYIIAGSAETGSDGADHGALIIRTDAHGDTLWTRIFDPGDQWDEANSIEPAPDGGWIAAGTAKSYAGNDDMWLLRLAETGDTLWTRTFGGDRDDAGFWAIPATDGGFIACGQTYSSGAGQTDAWLVKVADNGDSTWARTYGGASYDNGYKVRRCLDGGYAVTGYTQSFGGGSSEVYFLKTKP